MEILVGVGLHARCPVAVIKIRSSFKKQNCARKIFNLKRREQDIKSCYNPHL